MPRSLDRRHYLQELQLCQERWQGPGPEAERPWPWTWTRPLLLQFLEILGLALRVYSSILNLRSRVKA